MLFSSGDEIVSSKFVSSIHDRKFDVEKMRKVVAFWILMHEHPFSILENEGFNLMKK